MKKVAIFFGCLCMVVVLFAICPRGQPDASIPTTKTQADNLLKAAQDSLEKNKFSDALESVEQVIKSKLTKATRDQAQELKDKILATQEAEISLDLARFYQEAGDFEQAKTVAQEVRTTYKDNPDIQARAKVVLKKILIAQAQDGQKKNQALLAAGNASLTAGNYDDAIDKAKEVFSSDPPPDAIMSEKAKQLLKDASQKKIKAVTKGALDNLAAARTAIDAGNYDEAVDKANLVLSESSINEDTREKAQNLLKQALEKKGNWTRAEFSSIFSILKWPLYALILLGLIKLVSLLYKSLNSCKRLQFLDLQDNTDLGVRELFVAALNHWKSQKSSDPGSLLKLERPRTAFLLGSLPQDKLTSALEKLPDIGTAAGTVTLKEWGTGFSAVARWFALCPPWVSANFYKDKDATTPPKEITARVTLERETGRVTLVSVWPEPVTPAPPANPGAGGNPGSGQTKGKSPPSSESSQDVQDSAYTKAIKRGANSLAFKVLYLLAVDDASVAQAEAFDRLRHGMILLNRHISGGPFEDLQESRRIFEEVRKNYPMMLSAYLYEGLALAYLSKPQEAAGKFGLVKEGAQQEGNDPLRKRAAFNEALAHLYIGTYEEVNTASELLNQLLGQDKKSPDQESYKESPLMAKAYCAQALTVALQPCFWESHYKNKADLKKKLAEWQDEVETITGKLEELLAEKYQRTEPPSESPFKKWIKQTFRPPRGDGAEKPELWDRSDCRRLHKAIHETRGHFYLNCAIGPLNNPTLAPLDGFEQPKLLNKALEDFQQCGMLLSPEVDTLTALGTSCLFRHDYKTARDYLKQAAELNPRYELAVFRLAQTWERENPHKAREILADYRRKSTPPLDKDEVQERYDKLPLPITQPRRKLELWYPLGEAEASR